MGNVGEKLKEYFDSQGITQKDLAEKLHVSKAYINALFSSRTKFGKKQAEKWSNEFGLSPSWLLTGEGDMCVDGNGIAVSTNEHTCTILYFPEVDASMGNVDFGEENNAPRHNTIEMVLPYLYNAEFAINAYGDSMSPLIKDGQIVLLSKWQENYIEWGKVYLVCTRSHRTIKRLFPVENDDTRIKCVSENSECYPPFNINKEDIQKMYIVRGHISKDTL